MVLPFPSEHTSMVLCFAFSGVPFSPLVVVRRDGAFWGQCVA